MSLNRSAAVARRELHILRADPLYFIVFTLMPLVVMAFVKPGFRFAVAATNGPDVNGAEQAVPGMTVMFALFLMGSVGFGVFREHGWGMWERFRASWATPSEIMAGKIAVPLLQSAVQMAVLFGLGGLLYDLHISGAPLALAATAAAFSLCVVSMGLALLAICKTLMQMNALANLGAIVLAGLGGAIAPSSALPGWASSIAPATPSYWAMRGFRSVILDGGGFSEVALPMAVLLGFAVAFSAVAVSRLKFEETKTAWA